MILPKIFPARMAVLLLLVIVNLLGLSAQSPLQSRSVHFEHIGIREGLSQNTVNCIFQDSRGFIWIGTQDGLNRYDGYEFKVYTPEADNKESLLNSYISFIYESPGAPGVLWIGTASGLCRYDFDTETFTSSKNDSRYRNILENVVINVGLEDREGDLWLGTSGEGLYKFDVKTADVVQYKNTPITPNRLKDNNVTALAQDLEGNLWIGTSRGGISRFCKKTGSFTMYKKNPIGLNNYPIRSIINDQSGDIWIGTAGAGLIKLHRDKQGGETFTLFTHDPTKPGGLKNNFVRTIYEDRSGLLWIGTSGSGLFCFRKDTGQFINYTYNPDNPNVITHTNIRAIFEDRAGSLWIGTAGGGINKLDRQSDKFTLYKPQPHTSHSLSPNNIWAITEGKDGVFLIGTDQGVYQFNIQKGTFYHLKHNPRYPNSSLHNRVLTIFEDSSRDLWLGTDGGGLYKYNRKKDTFSHYKYEPENPGSLSHNNIQGIIEDRTGVLWIATTGGGISCLHPKNRKDISFTIYNHVPGDPTSLSHNRVFCIYEDREGIIWVGTLGGGMCRFDLETRSFSHFKKEPGTTNCLNENRVFSIYRDSAGTFWIGTAGGLNNFDMINNRWTHYTTQEGLPNNFIYGVLEEEPGPGKPVGNLWMSTNKGLSRFNPETGEFKNYDISDGLQSNEFNGGAFAKSKNGFMFFGGINGFNVFDPRKIKDNPYVPPVVLTDFQIFNKPVPIRQADDSPLKKSITETREIELTYRENSFSFGFAALNYISPEKNRYAYMLEGFNHDWIPLKKRQLVTYTNVPPGEYIFRVKGSNNDGKWNEKGASIIISISPLFWATWWFRLSMIILFLGNFFLLHKIRTANIRQKLRRERLEKELKLKADFTAMLVHDLRSPLAAIIGYSEMLEEMPEKMDIKRTGKVIAKSSEKMMTLIDDMLDLSKFEAGKMTLNKKNVTLFEIVTDIVEVMAPLLDKKEMNLVWEPDADTKEERIFIDPERIGQVVNNLFSNAIKFVPKKGTILIRLSRENIHFLELSMTDDGPGVPAANRKYLFEKYARLDKKLNVKSTGLGLAVSKLIIEAHEGTIGFRPGIDGNGSTFYFRLPVVKD